MLCTDSYTFIYITRRCICMCTYELDRSYTFSYKHISLRSCTCAIAWLAALTTSSPSAFSCSSCAMYLPAQQRKNVSQIKCVITISCYVYMTWRVTCTIHPEPIGESHFGKCLALNYYWLLHRTAHCNIQHSTRSAYRCYDTTMTQRCCQHTQDGTVNFKPVESWQIEVGGTDSCTPLTGSAATLQSVWQLRYVLQPPCLPVPDVGEEQSLW